MNKKLLLLMPLITIIFAAFANSASADKGLEAGKINIENTEGITLHFSMDVADDTKSDSHIEYFYVIEGRNKDCCVINSRYCERRWVAEPTFELQRTLGGTYDITICARKLLSDGTYAICSNHRKITIVMEIGNPMIERNGKGVYIKGLIVEDFDNSDTVGTLNDYDEDYSDGEPAQYPDLSESEEINPEEEEKI